MATPQPQSAETGEGAPGQGMSTPANSGAGGPVSSRSGPREVGARPGEPPRVRRPVRVRPGRQRRRPGARREEPPGGQRQTCRQVGRAAESGLAVSGAGDRRAAGARAPPGSRGPPRGAAAGAVRPRRPHARARPDGAGLPDSQAVLGPACGRPLRRAPGGLGARRGRGKRRKGLGPPVLRLFVPAGEGGGEGALPPLVLLAGRDRGGGGAGGGRVLREAGRGPLGRGLLERPRQASGRSPGLRRRDADRGVSGELAGRLCQQVPRWSCPQPRRRAGGDPFHDLPRVPYQYAVLRGHAAERGRVHCRHAAVQPLRGLRPQLPLRWPASS
mmetsp:Transcript_100885/g.311165  ORF Transcript_100885/g.311165 Transcript_100885/m.311165 type:complete len:329 (-) Transcript_100885:673-1659(-)